MTTLEHMQALAADATAILDEARAARDRAATLHAAAELFKGDGASPAEVKARTRDNSEAASLQEHARRLEVRAEEVVKRRRELATFLGVTL